MVESSAVKLSAIWDAAHGLANMSDGLALEGMAPPSAWEPCEASISAKELRVYTGAVIGRIKEGWAWSEGQKVGAHCSHW